jgi:hypothetical protein
MRNCLLLCIHRLSVLSFYGVLSTKQGHSAVRYTAAYKLGNAVFARLLGRYATQTLLLHLETPSLAAMR